LAHNLLFYGIALGAPRDTLRELSLMDCRYVRHFARPTVRKSIDLLVKEIHDNRVSALLGRPEVNGHVEIVRVGAEPG
jgi:hypothetical protein